MSKRAGILVVVGLLAVGGFAVAGCGGGDSTGATTASTAATTTTAEGDAAAGASPTDVYNDCTAAIAGTPAESTGQAACAKARDAFQKCIDKAATLDGDAKKLALKACQATADQAIERISGE